MNAQNFNAQDQTPTTNAANPAPVRLRVMFSERNAAKSRLKLIKATKNRNF
jgi:hypothetical protein